MKRAGVYALIASAFVIFLIVSPLKQHRGRNHVAFNRRLGYEVSTPDFDPLVLLVKKKNERLCQERKAEKNSSMGNLDIDFEGKLNTTLRLLVLFPFLDKTPEDGLVSFEELEAWNTKQALDNLFYRALKDLKSYDRNGDEAVSFAEYLPQFSKEDIERNEKGHGEAGWWMEQFKNADIDRNGNLNLDEFNDFLHPEDSNNEEIQKWLLREKIKQMDDDHDGELDSIEFSKYAYDIYTGYAKFEQSASSSSTAHEKFKELDINKDGFLRAEELIPMLHYLKPGELSYARYYTNYLMQESDDNEDGYLTLTEMLNHEDTFFNTVYGHEEYDDYHDEL